MGPGLAFGLLIVLFGLSILAETIFQVHIPFFRLIFGLFLIYLGVRILAGGFWRHHWDRSWDRDWDYRLNITGSGSYTPRADEDRPKYSIVFSRGTVDLSQLAKNGEGAWAEVTVVFGNALVKVDPAVPREVEINTAFGEVHLPNQTTGNIGNYHYRPPGQTGEPRLHLKLNVVFGGCQVVEQG